ncbi:hypothetical protein BJ741DRAFT_431795 [Chytriomyces cf. hyalinus JEL632]|nr:hypothetical protein BJ741DRAFT_431795 [Chytriomyces cf. hyalinus JEL632]
MQSYSNGCEVMFGKRPAILPFSKNSNLPKFAYPNRLNEERLAQIIKHGVHRVDLTHILLSRVASLGQLHHAISSSPELYQGQDYLYPSSLPGLLQKYARLSLPRLNMAVLLALILRKRWRLVNGRAHFQEAWRQRGFKFRAVHGNQIVILRVYTSLRFRNFSHQNLQAHSSSPVANSSGR